MTAAASLAAFVTITVMVMSGSGLGWWDSAARLEAIATRQAALTVTAQVMTWLGSAPVLVVVGVLAAAALWVRDRRPLLPVALLATLATSAGLVTMLKIAVGRPRPPAEWVIGSASVSNAFPSGHTTDGSVVYVLAALLLVRTVARPFLRRAVVVAALVLALLIGWSRMYLGFHWLSDVVAGWLLATAIISTTMTVVRRWSLPSMPASGAVVSSLSNH